jgi:hypothetical protein
VCWPGLTKGKNLTGSKYVSLPAAWRRVPCPGPDRKTPCPHGTVVQIFKSVDPNHGDYNQLRLCKLKRGFCECQSEGQFITITIGLDSSQPVAYPGLRVIGSEKDTSKRSRGKIGRVEMDYPDGKDYDGMGLWGDDYGKYYEKWAVLVHGS